MIQWISLLILDEWQKLLSFTHLSAQLLCCYSSVLHRCWLLLHTIMPLSVALLYDIGYRRLIPGLLEQPKMMAPRGTWGSLCLPVCSLPVPLPWTGRRSLLCRVALLCPVWVIPPPLPHCELQHQSPHSCLSLCWPLCSADSLCSSSHRSSGSNMSSSFSSSANDGQGKPKPKSPFRKRGSLQSTTSPGECVCKWVL